MELGYRPAAQPQFRSGRQIDTASIGVGHPNAELRCCQPVSRHHAHQPGEQLHYAYDALDRLTNQSDSASYRVWDYDANGNRISEQSGATVYPYTIDTNSNRLLSVAGPVAKTYTYDAAGNPLGDGTRTFIWDAVGRLVELRSVAMPRNTCITLSASG